VLASELAERSFSYLRSNNSPWTLSLKDVVHRVGDLEMAYNVNDCVELALGRAGDQRGGLDLQAFMRRPSSAPRCWNTAPGSTSGAVRHGCSDRQAAGRAAGCRVACAHLRVLSRSRRTSRIASLTMPGMSWRRS